MELKDVGSHKTKLGYMLFAKTWLKVIVIGCLQSHKPKSVEATFIKICIGCFSIPTECVGLWPVQGTVKNQNSFLSNIGLNLGHALASFAT